MSVHVPDVGPANGYDPGLTTNHDSLTILHGVIPARFWLNDAQGPCRWVEELNSTALTLARKEREKT